MGLGAHHHWSAAHPILHTPSDQGNNGAGRTLTNDLASAVKTAADTFNTAVTVAQAESVAVDVRINYAAPAGTLATPGVMTHQGIVVTTSLPLPLV
jgi:hypothetical protein